MRCQSRAVERLAAAAVSVLLVACAAPSPTPSPSAVLSQPPPTAVANATPPPAPSASETEVPALTVIDPRVVVTPATGLHDGQTVLVRITGFSVGGKQWVSECSSSAVATDLGCGSELAAQTELVTDNSRTGSASFIVRSHASNGPNGSLHSCGTHCVIVVTVGGGYAFALAPISFAP